MASGHIEKGREADVVISSRVRLARNLKDYPFPIRMKREQEIEVLSKVKDVVLNSNSSAVNNFLFVDIQGLPSIDRQSMVEKHLISPDLAESQRHSGAIISRDEKISIMINEEDHLRIQSLFPGMQLKKAWDLCNKIDMLLEEKIDFAFSGEYGYLTCCPTNIGTGIRASVMLHLPALTMTGYIKGILEACGKLGITVRGMYGENSEAAGNMFQVSNQVTLGLSEEEIIQNVTNIASQVIDQERTIRKELYKQNSYRFEDKVYRSLGVLSSARILSTEESLKLISDVRLGIEMGIITNINLETLNEITLITQPATLQKATGKPLNPEERDIMRAEMVRKKLSAGNAQEQ